MSSLEQDTRYRDYRLERMKALYSQEPHSLAEAREIDAELSFWLTCPRLSKAQAVALVRIDVARFLLPLTGRRATWYRKALKAKHHQRRMQSASYTRQLATYKAKRASETPEERAARLSYAQRYYYAHRAEIRAKQNAKNKLHREELLAKHREKINAQTPEQREERRRKNQEYAAKNRAKINAQVRARRARYAAQETPEARAVRLVKQQAYRDAHREQRRIIEARSHAKRKRASDSTSTAPAC